MADETETETEKEKERGGVVMDTPERTQIATPLSRFEDSPVFNYINSLSPIKPVKSVHFTQAFSSLSFASLPSVFTSPHVSSLKDSRFLRRHQFSDPSKPENANKAEGTSKAAQNPSKEQKDSESGGSVVPSNECSNPGIEPSRTLGYEAASPDTMNVVKMAGPSVSVAPFIHDGSANIPMRGERVVEELDPINPNKGVSGCDWDSLISDASELLNFDSPSDTVPFKGTGESNLDPNPEAAVARPCENLNEAAENQVILATTSLNNLVAGEPPEDIDNEVDSNLYRGMRRRCLVFEMVGSRRKHLEDVSGCSSRDLSESNETIQTQTGNDSSRCIVPGIGLHLNALATSLVDHKVVKHDLGSGAQLIITPPSAAAYNSMASDQESMKQLEEDTRLAQNRVPLAEDASKAIGFVLNEDSNQSSPRKKRRKVEHAGESEACKRCNCKKSKCLKLYCECFAAGVYCVEPCSCQECFNKPIHEDTVLATRKQIESRNPLAFAPKVIRNSDSVLEVGDESSKTPASARHKRGCNCKKSGCLKKYCECYQGGVGCSVNCRCEGCKNTFGRKDGCSETDGGDEVVEPISAIPCTPSCFGRRAMRSKPPPSFVGMGSCSQRFGKVKQLETVGEDEFVEEEGGSPVKSSASPNGKRVSPPQSTTRKLILQSIPSFPSLSHP